MASCVPSDFSLKMGEMIINNESITKVDCIARIDLFGFWYYNIFRRYNSTYDIIVEDIHKNIIHLDTSYTTIRQIIKHLLNIPDTESQYMYISNSCSLEHNCALSTVELYGLDTPLWFIQKLYSALYLNIQGIHTHTDEGLSVDIPKPDPADSFYQAASDSDDMSMRVVSVSERRSDRHYELEYMELRSGRKIYKM